VSIMTTNYMKVGVGDNLQNIVYIPQEIDSVQHNHCVSNQTLL
jgi:hypothetical protein